MLYRLLPWGIPAALVLSLYLLPALFAGLGINIVSHVLNNHLDAAERRFARQHPAED